MTDLPRVPAHVQPFVDVLGVEGAVSFLLKFGGASSYFASRPQDRGRLTQAIGADAVVRLSEASLPSRVPTAKPWIAQVLHMRGLPVAEIARKLHVSDVSVRRWLKGPREGQVTPSTQFRLI